jgi:hypothetical protein
VCISYGNWPAEPFLLLWGFTPQPNPADAVVVFSSLKEMAACYFDFLKFKLTAGGSAEQLLQCEQLCEAVQRQLESASVGSSSSGRDGSFVNMTIDASSIDGRLKAALTVLQGAAATAAAGMLRHPTISSSSRGHPQQQQLSYAAKQPEHTQADLMLLVRQSQQIRLGELLVFRLGVLADALEGSCETCAAAIQHVQAEKQLHSNSGSLHKQQQQQQQQPDQQAAKFGSKQVAAADAGLLQAQRTSGTTGANDSSSLQHMIITTVYQASAEHLELIRCYCSSKAALARQLAGGYPIIMSGVFLV